MRYTTHVYDGLRHSQQSGARRLRDAIVFGFQMQRHPGREIEIPDWYSLNGTRLGPLPVTVMQQSASLSHEL